MYFNTIHPLKTHRLWKNAWWVVRED